MILILHHHNSESKDTHYGVNVENAIQNLYTSYDSH